MPSLPRPPSSSGVAVETSGLRHTYPSAHGDLVVLHGLDLAVPAGGYVALTGASGAGKSTLLSLLGGLEPVQEGRAWVGGRSLAELRGDALAAYRRETVGFVFQHYGLVPVLSARENVELALTLSGADRGQRRQRADGLLTAVGLEHRVDHRPPALSGGERQRVAIARAMSNDPPLLLADEPTGNLDEEAASQVLHLLERLRADRGCTLIVVTHNRSVADRAERRLRLDAGRWAA
jgi:predicted ABC-type transport system involved in lysophospholipase L1 biosynthesis ATPase subunit